MDDGGTCRSSLRKGVRWPGSGAQQSKCGVGSLERPDEASEALHPLAVDEVSRPQQFAVEPRCPDGLGARDRSQRLVHGAGCRFLRADAPRPLSEVVATTLRLAHDDGFVIALLAEHAQ